MALWALGDGRDEEPCVFGGDRGRTANLVTRQPDLEGLNS